MTSEAALQVLEIQDKEKWRKEALKEVSRQKKAEKSQRKVLCSQSNYRKIQKIKIKEKIQIINENENNKETGESIKKSIKKSTNMKLNPTKKMKRPRVNGSVLYTNTTSEQVLICCAHLVDWKVLQLLHFSIHFLQSFEMTLHINR